MFSLWSVLWLYHEYEASSTQQSDSREVGQFSTSQYEARREVNAVTVNINRGKKHANMIGNWD
jgi:hypothetical protein